MLVFVWWRKTGAADLTEVIHRPFVSWDEATNYFHKTTPPKPGYEMKMCRNLDPLLQKSEIRVLSESVVSELLSTGIVTEDIQGALQQAQQLVITA